MKTDITADAGQSPDSNGSELPDYTQQLLLDTDSGQTVFRLWAPSADGVLLKLYTSCDISAVAYREVAMTACDNGCWTAAVPDLLYGCFYTFRIRIRDQWLGETPGIWAKAVGTNGLRAAIIDMQATDPPGWENDHRPVLQNPTDAVIYELHLRDFSIHRSSGISNRGKFLSLTENRTSSPEGLPTGIDHLIELGITHVHIMPVSDFISINESDTTSRQYNWGYDPLNFNVPEGSYSSDATNPATRIKELKEMVMALHSAGIGVILDVVYNHTALGDGSNFSLTAPGYYYRYNSDGSYSNASGCGNETASEQSHVRDFIVRSVKYWAEEYHIDGFRFDLMAVHDIDTMNLVAETLHRIDPSILIYGEGWTAAPSTLPACRRASKENAGRMPRIAVYCDDMRDAMKGFYANDADRGFISGKPGLEEALKVGIVAATGHPEVDYLKNGKAKAPYAKAPGQIVNYVSCHDGPTLADKLRKSLPNTGMDNRLKIARLAQTIVFTSQGIPFIMSGEEFFRSKKGITDSYRSPDSVNAIDWSLKNRYYEQFRYHKELIKLRKSHPAFRMTNATDIARHIRFDPVEHANFLSYTISDHANGDSWEEIKIFFNGSPRRHVANVRHGQWKVIACDGRINAEGLGLSDGGKITVPPYSAMIIAR